MRIQLKQLLIHWEHKATRVYGTKSSDNIGAYCFENILEPQDYIELKHIALKSSLENAWEHKVIFNTFLSLSQQSQKIDLTFDKLKDFISDSEHLVRNWVHKQYLF